MIPTRRKALRKELRSARRALTPAQQKQASRRLFRQLAKHPMFVRSRHIALYLANDGEIDPILLLRHALRLGKTCYLPVLKRWPRGSMGFQRIHKHQQWTRNRFGITEPRASISSQTQPWRLDMVLMPLVGFDVQGNRLGMGGGFYDRTFAYLRQRQTWLAPSLIGLAHDCQKLDRLPVESWDIPLDGIISDAECLMFKRA
ncbi:5-formyltetrahydrofolate cyclo-ligase [uncultured Halopseudomonas sp.]|uniref:5-formyltetrahydrofolate cyclo-ligase n=1 Tax=uncultured Halopseudomonas sp. TaxID=2901193 RepID=UPI0030EE0D17|tara:strand:+ start:5818 stop:6420 length:603 start_codon:yes stop_codon:yes gene_type:complete